MAPFRYSVRVRYHECDAQARVYFANYLKYIDDAKLELVKEAFGSYEGLTAHGIDLVTAHASADFVAPAGFDDRLDVLVAITRLGERSISVGAAIGRCDVTLVNGTITLVSVDPTRATAVPIPPDVRSELLGYVEQSLAHEGS